MPKEPCQSAKRALSIYMKSPVNLPKEPYQSAKRALSICQKSPINLPKEPYQSFKRHLRFSISSERVRVSLWMPHSLGRN